MDKKTMLVAKNLLEEKWTVKLVGEELLAKKGSSKWLVKAIWGQPNQEPVNK